MESDEFRKQVKDALKHLCDTVYLQVHPLLPQITDATASDQLTRAQKLRGLLKDAIETLRQQQGSPSSSPHEAWRSYLALLVCQRLACNMVPICAVSLTG